MQARKPTGYLSGNVYLDPPECSVWFMRYRLPNGKESRRKIGPNWAKRGRPPEGFYTERTAEKVLSDLLDRHKHLVTATPTLEVAAREYLRWLEADKKLNATTLRNYRNIIEHELLTYRPIKNGKPHGLPWGHRELAVLTVPDILEYRASLVARGLAGSTLNQRRTVLNGIFKRARRAYMYFGPNVATEFDRARIHNTGKIRAYSAEQVHALIRHALNPQDAVLFLVSAFAGLRRSEVIALRWRQVRFDLRAILIEENYTPEGGTGDTKGHRVRKVPMSPQVMGALNDLSRRAHFTRPDDLVFANDIGREIDGSALYRRYKKACRAAELPELRLHDLRHTFGTLLIAHPDVTVWDLKGWMGHKYVTTTEAYLHFKPEWDASDTLGEAFSTDPFSATNRRRQSTPAQAEKDALRAAEEA